MVPSWDAYNFVLAGLCGEGKMGSSLVIYGWMVKVGVGANFVTYNGFISGFCRERRMAEAKQGFDEMVEKGLAPNVVHYTAFSSWVLFGWEVGSCRGVGSRDGSKWPLPECGDLQWSHQWVFYRRKSQRRVEAFGCDERIGSDEFTYSTLIDGLCKEGRLGEATSLFCNIENKGLGVSNVVYNTLISVFCKVGHMGEAKKLFEEIAERGLEPEVITYNTLMDGFFKIGNIKAAKELLCEMGMQGLEFNIFTSNTWMSCLCKAGELEQLANLFEEMAGKRYSLMLSLLQFFQMERGWKRSRYRRI